MNMNLLIQLVQVGLASTGALLASRRNRAELQAMIDQAVAEGRTLRADELERLRGNLDDTIDRVRQLGREE